jgi:hypothetical protein
MSITEEIRREGIQEGERKGFPIGLRLWETLILQDLLDRSLSGPHAAL